MQRDWTFSGVKTACKRWEQLAHLRVCTAFLTISLTYPRLPFLCCKLEFHDQQIVNTSGNPLDGCFLWRTVSLQSGDSHESFCLLRFIWRLSQSAGDDISKGDFAGRNLSRLARIACFKGEALLLQLTPSKTMEFKIKLNVVTLQ